MALILNIYTATEVASVCLMEDDKLLAIAENESQKEHATWLQTAIKQLLETANRKIEDLNAIAVAEGPGSYTGLRVGMASAKGLCYALNIPLITESSLKVMALASTQDWAKKNNSFKTEQIILFCPMIDARRLEVFCAIYDHQLNIIQEAGARILDETSFNDLLSRYLIIFSGSGSSKFSGIVSSKNAHFQSVKANSFDLGTLSYQKYLQSAYADLAYAEPAYLKEFHIAGKH